MTLNNLLLKIESLREPSKWELIVNYSLATWNYRLMYNDNQILYGTIYNGELTHYNEEKIFDAQRSEEEIKKRNLYKKALGL